MGQENVAEWEKSCVQNEKNVTKSGKKILKQYDLRVWTELSPAQMKLKVEIPHEFDDDLLQEIKSYNLHKSKDP